MIPNTPLKRHGTPRWIDPPRAHRYWTTAILTMGMAAAALALSLTQSLQSSLDALAVIPQVLFASGNALSSLGQEGYRLITALFVHVDGWHLAGNLVFLWLFARAVEQAIGSIALLGFFLLCGGAALLCAAWFASNPQAPIVGASGAISAVIGGHLALRPTARLGLVIPLGFFVHFMTVPAVVLLLSWCLIQVAFSFVGPTFGAVAWIAHGTGFAFGLLIGFLLRGWARARARN